MAPHAGGSINDTPLALLLGGDRPIPGPVSGEERDERQGAALHRRIGLDGGGVECAGEAGGGLG